METQNHTCCKRNYSYVAVFLHFRGTNNIAGSRLSIGKAGVYSREQDKKKKKITRKETTLLIISQSHKHSVMGYLDFPKPIYNLGYEKIYDRY